MENNNKRKVGIIGAGPSGLAAAKAALEEGFELVLFEKCQDLGGVWNCNASSGCVWSQMRTNITRYSMSYSDHDWPSSTPIFPEAQQVLDYLRSFSDKYKITERIRFNMKVVKAYQCPDSTNWQIEALNMKSNITESFILDYLVVATGIFCEPNFPECYQNATSQFKGLLIHSKYYNKYKSELGGKHVCLIGSSYSAYEIASDLVGYAQTITNVIRKPYWVLPKLLAIKNNNELVKMPVDCVFYNQKAFSLMKNDKESFKVVNKLLADFCSAQQQIDELRVKEEEFENPPKMSISEHYVEYVQQGKIQVKQGEIANFSSTQIHFKDQSALENVDAVIFCTGYSGNIDFFDESVKNLLEYDAHDRIEPILLYKSTFHSQFKNLAFLDLFRDTHFLMAELQSTWIMRVFSGKLAFPIEEKFQKGVQEAREIRNRTPKPQFRHSYVGLGNLIAEELGMMPDMKALESDDPDAFRILNESLVLPDFYRFSGNNKKQVLEKYESLNQKIRETLN